MRWHRRGTIERGFTLLEMLVALILLAMITGLLMQALGHFLQARERAASTASELAHQGLQERWFRDSIRGLATGPTETPPGFSGRADRFSGTSLAAPDAQRGVPTRVTWRLVRSGDRTALRYQSGDRTWTIREWSGEAGQFAYLDATGEWRERWPPPAGPSSADGTDAPALPRAILVDGNHRGEPFLWVASPLGPHRQRPDLRRDLPGQP